MKLYRKIEFSIVSNTPWSISYTNTCKVMLPTDILHRRSHFPHELRRLKKDTRSSNWKIGLEICKEILNLV